VHPVAAEGCPLCGAPLDSAQDWCLRCGAAARTRLAAAPRWRTPLVLVALVATLALAVIAAALVKLAGETAAPPPIHRTVTTLTPAAGPASPAPAAPGATAPGTATPGAPTPGAGSTETAPRTATPGATGAGTAGTGGGSGASTPRTTAPRAPGIAPGR
jgi:hypothetical protein